VITTLAVFDTCVIAAAALIEARTQLTAAHRAHPRWAAVFHTGRHRKD
jgi:hypothetical protein